MKLRNESLANLEVGLRTGTVKFDENGIADVQPDDFAEELAGVPGYSIVLENGQTKVTITEDSINLEGAEIVINKPTVDLESKTEKQLDALAEELAIEDYPKSGNKATKKAAIGAFLAEQK